jgi:predicted XRE-type DNA-binding protein
MKDNIELEKSSGNVFKDLGVENPEQELLKAELAYCVFKAIDEKNLTQVQAAKLIGVTQPDISKLKNGQYYRFTSERLFKFLNALDYDIDIKIHKAENHKAHLRIIKT